MKQLIDKAALVAEIERRKSELQLRIVELGTFESNTLGLFQEVDLYDDIISFINTIETKEVDLEKEARHYLLNEHLSPLSKIMHMADLKSEMQYHKDIENAFKAGFGLGMAVSDKTQEGE